MNSTILIFAFLIVVLQILFDIYTNIAWKRFVRLQGWDPRFYQIVWIVSVLMPTASVITMYRRLTLGVISTADFTVQQIVWLWYLPKVPIVLILLIKDITKLIRWLWKRFISIYGIKTPTNNVTSEKINTSRRDFVQKSSWALAGAPFIVAADGLYREVYDFKVENVSLKISGLHSALEGLRIVQISDIHAGYFVSQKPMQEASRLLRQQKGDIIVVTGDFVNSHPAELSTIYRELERLSAPLGVYGVFGNHDHFMPAIQHEELMTAIQKTTIDLIINSNRKLSIDGANLAIAGIDNTGFNQNFGRLDRAADGISPDTTTILLAHDPTFWDKEVRRKTHVDVMLSGHTHGGQIAFSIPGATISPAQIVYKQWAGLYRDDNQLLYVNRGLGTVGPPIRIGVPPEISVFTLTRAV